MLPAVLVLLVISSALALPTVGVTTYNINEVKPAQNTSGRLVSGALINRALELVDGGDQNIYIVMMEPVLEALANQPDARSQATAVTQLLAVLGELAFGTPGDVCDAAAAINECVARGPTYNARRAWIRRLADNIGYINQLALNPNALRFATAPRGNCSNGGRIYQFEAAWNDVLTYSATPLTIGLYNEEYCAAKRLYQAFNFKSNNVGAAVTAATDPLAVSAVLNALPQIVNFLIVAVSGGNPTAQAQIAKAALLRSIGA